MRGFNRAVIAGNLTRDPEVRYTVNKKAYARFSVAVNSRWRNANGEYQENTEYINLVAWGTTAETCGKYLKKGSPILVEGRIRTGSYDAKDGSGKRYTTEIWIDNMVMLSSRQDSSGYNSMAQDTLADNEFGKPIGESGFSGGSFAGNFAGTNDENHGMSEDDIPF